MRNGGNEARFVSCGEPGICTQTQLDVTLRFICTGCSTGVKSRLSSSVADAAASIRSSHLFPSSAAALDGSAENAFRS